MIFAVIYDIRHFFLILLITIIAFADSILTLSNGNIDEHHRFAGESLSDSIIYIYTTILGDFATDKFG